MTGLAYVPPIDPILLSEKVPPDRSWNDIKMKVMTSCLSPATHLGGQFPGQSEVVEATELQGDIKD